MKSETITVPYNPAFDNCKIWQ